MKLRSKLPEILFQLEVLLFEPFNTLTSLLSSFISLMEVINRLLRVSIEFTAELVLRHVLFVMEPVRQLVLCHESHNLSLHVFLLDFLGGGKFVLELSTLLLEVFA